jgi:hypothetical protein
MNTLDIVLLNVVSYMGGILTGISIFVKYKHTLLVKTNSYNELRELVNNLTDDLNQANDVDIQTSLGAPIMTHAQAVVASAPTQRDLKEIVIRG